MKPRALDLFCGGGGVSEGLRRAGFEVVGVDIVDHSRVYNRESDEKLGAGPGSKAHPAPATFVQADALIVLEQLLAAERGALAPLGDELGHFDLICASPPCQAHSSLRHLQAGKVYPDLIEPVRELLKRWGGLWCIENVPGAPLGGAHLTQLCGTMFGLQTPDGRAELRRHRLFETSFSIPLRPACQHGHESLSVCGSGLDSGKERYRKRALSVTGHAIEISPSNWRGRKVLTVVGQKGLPGMSRDRRKVVTVAGATPQGHEEHNKTRETFSTDDARHAMGIDWMPMKQLSQAIPPAYTEWIGRQALQVLRG